MERALCKAVQNAVFAPTVMTAMACLRSVHPYTRGTPGRPSRKHSSVFTARSVINPRRIRVPPPAVDPCDLICPTTTGLLVSGHKNSHEYTNGHTISSLDNDVRSLCWHGTWFSCPDLSSLHHEKSSPKCPEKFGRVLGSFHPT